MKFFYQKTPFKIATYVLIGLSVLREWKAGYFKRFGDYLKTVRISFYLKYLALAALVTVAVMAGFDPWLCELAGRRTPFLDGLSEIAGHFGRKTAPWLFIGSGYWLMCFLKNHQGRLAAFGCLLSSALTGGMVTFFKYVFMRARPDQKLGHFSFFNFDRLIHNDNDFLSFSSGDVAIVAGASAYLFYRFRNPFARAVFCVLPVLNAFARTHGQRHWPSDGLFSILLGFLAAFFIYQFACYAGHHPLSEEKKIS